MLQRATQHRGVLQYATVSYGLYSYGLYSYGLYSYGYSMRLCATARVIAPRANAMQAHLPLDDVIERQAAVCNRGQCHALVR